MPTIDAPFTIRAVVCAVSRRHNTLEILKQQSIETEIEKVASTIRALAHIGNPRSIVLQFMRAPCHFHLEFDVALRVGTERGVIAPTVLAHALTDHRTIGLWVVSEPATNRRLGRARASRIHR